MSEVHLPFALLCPNAKLPYINYDTGTSNDIYIHLFPRQMLLHIRIYGDQLPGTKSRKLR